MDHLGHRGGGCAELHGERGFVDQVGRMRAHDVNA